VANSFRNIPPIPLLHAYFKMSALRHRNRFLQLLSIALKEVLHVNYKEDVMETGLCDVLLALNVPIYKDRRTGILNV
jgi:hypothetical protein